MGGKEKLEVHICTVPVKIKFPLRSSKTLQSRFHLGKKTLNDLKKTATFFYAPEFWPEFLTYRCLLPTNLRASNNLRGESFFAPPTHCKA